MSREQAFVRVITRYVVPVLLINQAATVCELTRRGEISGPVPAIEVGPQTRSDPAPIFRCIGAGGGVVVSLGGDGHSVFLYCDDVKG